MPLGDFELIKWSFPANQSIELLPVSDVHFGAAEHLEREWSDFCGMVLEKPNRYITLGGDLINNGTKSGKSNVYAEVVRPREQKRIMAEMLEPLKNRVLCIVPGNHEERSVREVDDDPCYDIACKLDLEHLYRENCAFVKIQIGPQDGPGLQNPTYTLAVTHGSGGGGQSGAALNRAIRFGYTIDGADALIVSHRHDALTSQPGKIVVDARNGKVSIKPFKIIQTTSWLGYGGYALRKMLQPCTYDPQTVMLYGDKKKITVTM